MTAAGAVLDGVRDVVRPAAGQAVSAAGSLGGVVAGAVGRVLGHEAGDAPDGVPVREGPATVFVDVDTQVDFLDPAGLLYVPGSTGLLPALERLTRHAKAAGIPVVASVCAHLEDDEEFALYPRHCLANTPGQLKVPATLLPVRLTLPADVAVHGVAGLLAGRDQLILQKRATDVFTTATARALVDELPAHVRWVVYGVALDVCVKAWVEGLLARGRRVAVVTDAVMGIDSAAGERMLAEWKTRGVELITAGQACAATVT